MRKLARRMVVVLAVLYVALFAVALFLSDSLIFQPHPSSYKDTPEIIKLTTRAGKKVSALYLQNPAARYTLLVSHGNAEDLGDDRDWLHGLADAGFNVLAYDYEGYGTSEGKPSEQAAYDDEDAVYDYLVTERKVSPNTIVIFGRSVGTGPAVHLAARRPVAGLILQSPFTSAFRVLTGIPILPFDKFPNARDIRRVHCPVLVMHGTSDTVIAAWHGRRLYELANEPKSYLWVEGADHNDFDIVAGPKYQQTLKKFASSLGAGVATAGN